MKKDLILATIIGILFIAGETILRIFLSPFSILGDLPIYCYNTNMSFWTLMGYSSIWMFIIAFIFSMVLGRINTKIEHDKKPYSYRLEVLFGWLFIILLEFLSGLLLNNILHLNVWDYSMFKLNLMGNIALIPSLMWLVLTPIIYFTDDVIRHYIWEEEKPDRFSSYFIDIIK